MINVLKSVEVSKESLDYYNDTSCQWKFKRSTNAAISVKREISSNSIFTIWNLFYNEPLYAASLFYKHHELKRSVYLWHRQPDSKQFYWQIVCTNGEFSIL